jgi:Glycosyl transferase 4-like
MKKILMTAMLDSVHTATWLNRIADGDLSIDLFPSKKFKYLHPEILKIVQNTQRVKIIQRTAAPYALNGYVDFLIHEVLGSKIQYFSRQSHFLRSVRKTSYSFVHALEIQGAGYLVSKLPRSSKDPRVIVTNWGSDIYFFSKFQEHEIRIRETLNRADGYSAECFRDYQLAKDFGFNGAMLPLIPNSGNFQIENDIVPSQRKQIIVKSYGGTFGLGNLTIEVVKKHLHTNTGFNYFFYSVSDEYIELVEELSEKFPGRVKFTTQRKPVPSEVLKKEFSKSRIYIGASLSDGISTSFLEALTTGTFPIQTITSCADEWEAKGVTVSLVKTDFSEIFQALEAACVDDALVDAAAIQNLKVVKEYLDPTKLSLVAKSFYV